MENIKKSKTRLEWMDVLRGLLILSVVIGHATGRFNHYIYQFHMGAFFIVSGYTAFPEKRSVTHTLYHRICTTYLPLLSAVVLFSAVSTALARTGLYAVFFNENLAHIGFFGVIKEFVKNGSIWAWWLGAAWFVLVLFIASVINRVILKLSKDQYGFLYFALSFLVFLYGYHLSKNAGLDFSFDLVLIAQFYVMLGTFGNRVLSKKIGKEKTLFQLLGFLFAGILMFLAAKFGLTMDFSARRFNFPIVDILLSVNGLVFCYFAAALIGRGRYLKKVLSFLGRNSLPVVFFHFVGFKLAYCILYLFKVVPFSYFQNFVPTAEIGNSWWPLLTLFSVLASLGIWMLMMQFRVVRILFGQDKQLYDRLWSWGKKAWDHIRSKMLFLVSWKRLLTQKLSDLISKINWKWCLKCSVVLLLIVLVMFPFVRQGIILNDEVQAYEARGHGFVPLIIRNARIELSQGRPLRIMAALNHALSFFLDNIYASRVIQMIWMLSAILSFSYFVYKISKNRKFAFFVGVIYLVSYPITFEHAPPNAFNGLTFIPMTELFLALSAFYTYLEKRKKRYLYLTVALMAVALLGYEFIITYIPIFPLLYLYERREERSFKKAVRAFLIAGMVVFAFLALMLIGQRIVPVNYSGAKMEITSIQNVLRVLSILFCSALPGYWLSHDKHQYLYTYYSTGNESLYAVLIVLVLLCVLFLFFRKNDSSEKHSAERRSWEKILIILVGIGYMIIPALPNSLSKLYQENMSLTNYTALPVTAYQYAASCFVLCSFIWALLRHFSGKTFRCLVFVGICVLTLNIQTMNKTFSDIQFQNSSRVMTAETLFCTNAMKTVEGKTVYSNDLYKQFNALVITGDFWETFALSHGIPDVDFVQELESGEKAEAMLFETGKHEWTLVEGNNITVFSKVILNGNYAVRIGENEFLSAKYDQFTKDSGWYVYTFVKNGKTVESASFN